MRDETKLAAMPPLPESTILLVEVGSSAHGTGVASVEDYDQIGVVLEGPLEVLGLSEGGFKTRMLRTQPEGVRSGPGDVDRTLFPLRRFVRLAAAGNPSILAALWSPVDYSTGLGDELRLLADAFVGRHVIPKFRGYMRSQAQRLLGTAGGGHGTRGSGRREELIAAHGYDTKYATHCARLGFQCEELLTSGGLRLPVEGEVGDWLRAVRRGDVPFGEWWERVLGQDAVLERLMSDERVRSVPDRERIESWMVDAHLRVWGAGVDGC